MSESKDEKENFTWPIGGINDSVGSFYIEFNEQYGDRDETTKCPHAISLDKNDERFKSFWHPYPCQWIVPRVVTAGGGYNTESSVCLDCILDAAKSLESKS